MRTEKGLSSSQSLVAQRRIDRTDENYILAVGDCMVKVSLSFLQRQHGVVGGEGCVDEQGRVYV